MCMVGRMGISYHVKREDHDERQASISIPFLNMKHTCSLL